MPITLCPDCGERLGQGYSNGDVCLGCFELTELANDLAALDDPIKIKARLRDEYGINNK